MRAKEYLLIFVVLSAVGCANAKRFLPPGFVKYEDLAKGRPVSEELQDDIALQSERQERKFPRLSAQPDAAPDAADRAVRERMMGNLEKSRDNLEATVEEDRQRAEADREPGNGVLE